MATLEGIHAVRCADCARSDSAVTGLRPSQQLAIPLAALSGHPDQVPGSYRRNRRGLFRDGIAGFASIYAASHLPWGAIWDAARAEAAGAPALVLLYLQGGADGLNMFVPTTANEFDIYTRQRGNIARVLGPSTSKQAVGTTGFADGSGLAFANPLVAGATNNQLYSNGGDIPTTAGGLDTLWNQGKLAVFPAADYNPPNLSHFDSRDYWFAGALSKLTTGWVGRWLDAEGSQVNPLQAVSLDQSLSKQIRTQTAPVCALDGLSGVQFQANGVNNTDPSAWISQLAGVAPQPGNGALLRARSSYQLVLDISNKIQGINTNLSGAAYPNSFLSDRLRMAAQLLSANLGVRVVTIDWGSFDTHGQELTSMDPQLAVLSAALSAFQADLEARSIGDQVVTLVFSEFGRRVASNDSAGTDHGAGGAMMMMGSRVRGGLCSAPPDLGNLDDDGDLRVETDFRWVYKAVFEEHLRTDPARYLPDLPPGSIQRADGTTTILR